MRIMCGFLSTLLCVCGFAGWYMGKSWSEFVMFFFMSMIMGGFYGVIRAIERKKEG